MISVTLWRLAKVWTKWAFRAFPDWKKRGRFSGKLLLEWRGALDYQFVSDPANPLRFERGSHPTRFEPTGEIIQPETMLTDGGSIPRVAWSIGLTPWVYMPGFIVHDYEFDQEHKKLGNKSLVDVNVTLCECIYTLMCDGVVPWSNLLMRLVYDGVSSPLGERAWKSGLPAPAPMVPFGLVRARHGAPWIARFN